MVGEVLTMTPVHRRVLRRSTTPRKGCWEWQGATQTFGHGVIGRGSRGEGTVLVHRAIWEWLMGPIPEGMVVMHECDNPRCVRLAHLRLGTRGDNNRDMFDKGRHPLAHDPQFLTRARWANR